MKQDELKMVRKVLDFVSERWKYHMMNDDELYGVKFPTMKPLGD